MEGRWAGRMEGVSERDLDAAAGATRERPEAIRPRARCAWLELARRARAISRTVSTFFFGGETFTIVARMEKAASS